MPSAPSTNPRSRSPASRSLGHRDDVPQLLSECALTINPLAGIRGSAVKLVESLAAGRACVSTSAGARGFLDDVPPGLVAVPDVPSMAAPRDRAPHRRRVPGTASRTRRAARSTATAGRGASKSSNTSTARCCAKARRPSHPVDEHLRQHRRPTTTSTWRGTCRSTTSASMQTSAQRRTGRCSSSVRQRPHPAAATSSRHRRDGRRRLHRHARGTAAQGRRARPGGRL